MLRGLLGLLALIALYLASAWILGHIRANSTHTDQGNIDIFLLSNGVHTDIAMPLHNKEFDWRTIVSPTDTRKATPADYVAFGWGDHGFYLETPTWADLTVPTALKAASGLNRHVLPRIAVKPKQRSHPHHIRRISEIDTKHITLISTTKRPRTHHPEYRL